MTTIEDASVSTTAAPTMHGGLANLDEEHSYWLDDVEGTVPADLQGTFYRNGPGRQMIGDQKYGHWFDGCGMLSVFSIDEGKVHFANRYVRTPKYVKETAKQQICYRGFGTQIPGGILKNVGRMPANPSNTNLVYHGGKLLTLYEGGRPFHVDATTLETHGEYTYDGGLKRSMVFSAHGHYLGQTGDWVNFGAGSLGYDKNGPKMCFNIFRIDSAGKVKKFGQLPIEHFPFAHDFAVSGKYAIFFVGSISMGSIGPVMLGQRTIGDGIGFDPSIPMTVSVVDLDTMQEVRKFETGAGAIIHFGNAFEDGDEVVVDAMFADNFVANDALSDVFNAKELRGGEFRRYRLNMASGEMSHEVMSPTNSEFPTFNQTVAGQKHEATYSAVSVENGHNSFFNGFQRVDFDGDIQLNTLAPGYFGSEPLFAPSKNSNADQDGYLFEVVYNAHEHNSSLMIFRAADIAEPVATLKLKHHLPHQFHGFWHDKVMLNDAR